MSPQNNPEECQPEKKKSYQHMIRIFKQLLDVRCDTSPRTRT